MPPCLVVELNEWQRRRLGFILIVLNLFVVCGGMGFLVCEWQLRERVSLIQHAANYGAEALEWLLVMSGFVFVVLHCVGGRFAWDAAVYYNRHRVADFLELWILCILSVVCLNGMGALLAAAQQSHLIHVLDRELGVALHEYDGRQQTRTIIDRLQIQLKCCGDHGYMDWMNVAWKSQIPYDVGERYFQNEDVVPFSCCRPSFPGPCLRHRGSQPLTMERLLRESVHQSGCREALRIYINYILTNVIVLHIITFILQLIILVLTRYLQTSIATSYLNTNPFLPSVGWLFEDFGSLTSQKKVWAEEARDRLEAKRIAAAWITVTRSEETRTLKPCIVRSKECTKVKDKCGLNPYYLKKRTNDDEQTVEDECSETPKKKSSTWLEKKVETVKKKISSTVGKNEKTSIEKKPSFKLNGKTAEEMPPIPTTVSPCLSPVPKLVCDHIHRTMQQMHRNDKKAPFKTACHQTDFFLDIIPTDMEPGNYRRQAGSTHKESLTRNNTEIKKKKRMKRHCKNQTMGHHGHEHSHCWKRVCDIQRLTAGGSSSSQMPTKEAFNEGATFHRSPALSLAALEALALKKIRIIHERDGLLVSRAKRCKQEDSDTEDS